ncbi:hypothetical protein Tco_1099985 [Tanacetum coccineum]
MQNGCDSRAPSILFQDADERLQGETAFSHKANNHPFALSILRMTKEATVDDSIKLSAANKVCWYSPLKQYSNNTYLVDMCSLKDIFLKILFQDADERLQGETAFSHKANNHPFVLSILRMTKEATVDDSIKLSAANKFEELVTSRGESSLNPILELEKKKINFTCPSFFHNIL